MKRRILFAAFCVVATLAFTSCELIASIFWQPVSVSEAHEAFQASGTFEYAGWNDPMTKVDNGSDTDYSKYKNAAGTLTWEGTFTNGGYPATIVITGNGYSAAGSGYSISGTLTEKYTTATYVTYTHDLDLSHATKPVQKISGVLTYNGSAWSGTLKFNNDSYDYSEFVY